MSRQIINRILLVLFVCAIFGMGILYVKQEHKISELDREYNELVAKEENVKYTISEYAILVDSVNSRNYVIRIARDMFGWVFDDEVLYTKPTDEPQDDSSSALEDSLRDQNSESIK